MLNTEGKIVVIPCASARHYLHARFRVRVADHFNTLTVTLIAPVVSPTRRKSLRAGERSRCASRVAAAALIVKDFTVSKQRVYILSPDTFNEKARTLQQLA